MSKLTLVESVHIPVKGRKANSSDYFSTFIRKSLQCKGRELTRDELKQFALFNVKALSLWENEDSHTSIRFESSKRAIEVLLAMLTPEEFMEVFPIDKQYDGYKYGMKDYFYVVKYMKTLEPKVPIGNKIYSLLSNYLNVNISGFYIKYLLAVSTLSRSQATLFNSKEESIGCVGQ